MTETTTRLWSPQEGFRNDDFVKAEALDAADPGQPVILPLSVWLDLGEPARSGGRPVGVAIAPGEPLDPILPYLDTLPLIALQFPAYTDGRSYSKASLLKGRHGYRGELRAVGDVLIDQVAHMVRVGFDTLEISNPATLRRLEEGRPGGIDLHYQSATRGNGEGGGYSWRRIG